MPFQPLISVIPERDDKRRREEAKAATTFLALVAFGRAAPETAGPLLRYGLGIEVATGSGLATANPLGVTNLLPQPFGFVPAVDYGLKPNFYLPGTTGAGAPSLIPGAAEQTAERDATIQLAREQRARQELLQFAQIQQQRGSQKLAELLAALRAGIGTDVYQSPDQIIGFLETELANRAAQHVAAEAARTQRLATQEENVPFVPGRNNFDPIKPIFIRPPVFTQQEQPQPTPPAAPPNPVIKPERSPFLQDYGKMQQERDAQKNNFLISVSDAAEQRRIQQRAALSALGFGLVPGVTHTKDQNPDFAPIYLRTPPNPQTGEGGKSFPGPSDFQLRGLLLIGAPIKPPSPIAQSITPGQGADNINKDTGQNNQGPFIDHFMEHKRGDP
jgi:hypothetical protein